MPPGRRQRRAFSNVPCVPSASIGHVRAAAGQALHFGDDIDLGEVEDDVGAHPPRHLETDRVAVDTDDRATRPSASRPPIAHRPIGPWANTTTESPIRTPAGFGGR